MIVVSRMSHQQIVYELKEDKIIISKNTTKWWKYCPRNIEKEIIWKTHVSTEIDTDKKFVFIIDEINRGSF